MTELKIGDIVLKPGRPKVAVPIVSKLPVDIIAECENIKNLPCDIIEWRADYYLSAATDIDAHLQDKHAYLDMVKILDDIEYIAGGKPVIFTLRSKSQGGEITLTRQQLESIYSIAAQSQLPQMIDIELCDAEGNIDEQWIRDQIDMIHSYGGKVILSHHDFEKMPEPAQIVDIVKRMYALGADICKVAAMADDKKDAETLLKVTALLNKNNIGPLITMAMGEYGKVTRVAGGRYGSCVTFAAGSAQSAPGQVDVYTMQKWLDDYYGKESLGKDA